MRDRLIDLLNNYREEISFCGRCDRPSEECESCMDEQLADYLLANGIVEVRHGEWKINPDGYYPYCSECGYEPEHGNMTKYCPECGTKMEGGDQNGNKTIFEESIQTTRTD